MTISPRTYDAIAARPLAFIGLGVMGSPMAGHLAAAGHRVRAYNRTAVKAQNWADVHKGQAAATPRAAAAGADIVFVCVGNDEDLRSVVLGDDGAFAGMTPGAMLVDHTTASAAVARELHALARARGLHFVDAPVSGGQAGAVNGALTVMCGGDAEPFEAVKPVGDQERRGLMRQEVSDEAAVGPAVCSKHLIENLWLPPGAERGTVCRPGQLLLTACDGDDSQ